MRESSPAQQRRAEEAARSAEAEISEEWGATRAIARAAAETLDNTPGAESNQNERERARLARKLKTFGDVPGNLDEL